MDIYHLAFGCPLLLTVGLGVIGNSKVPLLRIAIQVITICAVCLMTTNLLQAATTRQVNTRVGSVGLLGSQALLQFIDANSRPGENIFVYPDCPSYYFLSARTNPTRLSLLVYNYNTAAEFREVIQRLELQRVRLVIWDSGFQGRMNDNVFPGAKHIRLEMQIVEPYLQSRYRQVATVDGFRVLLRND
jgi:hypothetical protein